MAIEDWMPTLASLLAETPGLVQVHTYEDLPATLSVFPCLVILPERGTQMFGGPNIARHEVRAVLYVAGQLLPEAYATAVPFIRLFRNKLAGRIQLGLTNIEHAIPAPGNWYEGPGAIKYGDKELTGIIFRIEIKETETFSVSA